MDTLSGVHGGFKITKPNKFSGVQKTLKPWLTMVAINFKFYLTVFLTEESKILFVVSSLEKTAFHWVQPRLDDFLKNGHNDQKKETQQMFFKFGNFSIMIREAFGVQNEEKTIETQFLVLKQTQSAMIYGSRFKTLSYVIKWDDAALISHFYEGLKNKVKDAMVAIDRPKSLQKMIQVVIKIDDRQHYRFIDKKTWSKPIPKINYSLKKNPMELDAIEKKRKKKLVTFAGKWVI